jgi:hypothetical protein
MIDISQISGDSTVHSVSFDTGVARISIQDGETDIRYLLQIRTTVFFSDNQKSGCAHIRFDKLEQHLPIDSASRRYQVPASFAAQMEAVRQAHHLAIGLKASEFPLLFKVRDSQVLFACPIKSKNDIEILKEIA